MSSEITKFPVFDVDGTLLKTEVDHSAFLAALKKMPWIDDDLISVFDKIQIDPYLHKTLPFAFKSMFSITQNIRLHKFIQKINKAGEKLFQKTIIKPGLKVFNPENIKTIFEDLNNLGAEKLREIKNFFSKDEENFNLDQEKSMLEISREKAEPAFVNELLTNLKWSADTITPIKGAKEIVEQLRKSKDSFASIITGTWHDIAKFKLSKRLGLNEESIKFIGPKNSKISISELKAENKIPVITCDGPDSKGISQIETRENLFDKIKEGVSNFLGDSWDNVRNQLTYFADGMWDVEVAQKLKLKFIGVGEKLNQLKDKITHIDDYSRDVNSLLNEAEVPSGINVKYKAKCLDAAKNLCEQYGEAILADRIFIPNVIVPRRAMQV